MMIWANFTGQMRRATRPFMVAACAMAIAGCGTVTRIPYTQQEQAEAVNAQFVRFPDFLWNEQQESKLRTELYKALRPIVGSKMIDATNALFRLRRV